MEANFWVAMVIGVDGRVREAALLEDIGSTMAGPVLGCVKKWKYKPAIVNGSPAEFLAVAPFCFKLRNR